MALTQVTNSMIKGAVINALDHGLSTSGTRAENASAMLAAVTAAVAANATLYVPSGTYLMNPVSYDIQASPAGNYYLKIVGEGQFQNGTKFDFTTLTGSEIGFSFVAAGKPDSLLTCDFSNFAMIGPSDHRTSQPTNTVGLYMEECPNSTIEKVYITEFYKGFLTNTVYAFSTKNLKISACYIAFESGQGGYSCHHDHIDVGSNYCGLHIRGGGGLTFVSPLLQSCYYPVNVYQLENLNGLEFINPYFEDSGGVLVDNFTFDAGIGAAGSPVGAISNVIISGGVWTSGSGYLINIGGGDISDVVLVATPVTHSDFSAYPLRCASITPSVGDEPSDFYGTTNVGGQINLRKDKTGTYSGRLIFNGVSFISSGSGSPQGVVTAPIGSIYLRDDGGTGTSFYVKESDPTGNGGWVAK